MDKRDYSPARRATYAKCLRAARNYMWNGDGKGPRPDIHEYKFICQALVHAGFICDISQVDAHRTKEELQARLRGFVNLEDWAAVAGGVLLSEARDDHLMQGLRFLWIEEMLKEFER